MIARGQSQREKDRPPGERVTVGLLSFGTAANDPVRVSFPEKGEGEEKEKRTPA